MTAHEPEHGQAGGRTTRRSFLAGAGGAATLVALGSVVDRSASASAATPQRGRASGPAHDGGWPGRPPAAPHTAIVRPVAVASVSGAVSDASHLVNGGVTTLRARAGAGAPQIVLDYGQIVGGRPKFTVSRVTGNVTLKAVYSQSLPYLLPAGDGPGPGTPTTTSAAEQNVSFVGAPSGANLSRVEYYPIEGPGPVEGHLLQAGQRYQAISLEGDGTLRLSLVGFLPSYRVDTPDDPNAGAFSCSDALLDEIWVTGVHTVNACSVPVESVPPAWVPTRSGLMIYGCQYTGYYPGSSWTDYTVGFEVRIIDNEAAWLVRGGQTEQGIVCVLCAADDSEPISEPGTLRVYNLKDLSLIDVVQLPFRVRTSRWLAVTTVVAGSSLTVAIDGRQVYTNSTVSGMAGSGWAGFTNASGAVSLVRNLQVTDGNGTTLLARSLTDAGTARFVEACGAGTNRLPSIMDGATRDRMAFTGDLGMCARSVMSGSFDTRYVTGTLELFGQYQAQDGTIGIALPAQLNGPAATGTLSGLTSFSSPDYELGWANAGYEYWMHSGDREWFRSFWPGFKAVLNLLVSQVGSNNLLGGFELIATEASANAHFYGMLRGGTEMARAAHDPATAASWTATAAAVRTAINTLLFDGAAGMYGSSTTQLNVYDQSANGYALLYGVPDATVDVPKLLTNLTKALAGPLGPNASSTAAPNGNVGPYTTGWELFGRLEVQDTDAALTIIRDVWGAMLQENPYYSGGHWEYIAQDRTPGLGSGTSLAHGWSTAPVHALSKYVLGGRPLAPGFTTWLVEPRTGDLEWARGRVPTPQGPLAIDWLTTANGADGFTVNVDAPGMTSGYVGVKTTRSTALIDGSNTEATTVPQYAGQPGYAYFGPIPPGRHQVVVAD